MTSHKDIAFLNQRRGKIITQKGGWKPGKGVTSHGHALLDDLAKNASFFQVMLLNITGHLPEKRLAQWLESIFICLSWPDPRIWCNQMGAFGGSTRASPVASVCAGIMASDSTIYGPGTVLAGTQFITKALTFVEGGGTIAEFIEQQAKTRLGLNAPGFARPLAKGDERVGVMAEVAHRLNFTDGPHIKLAYGIEQHLLKTYDEAINLSGYIVAFLSDQGFNETEIYRIVGLCVNGGIHACYAENYDNPADSFLPLQCNDIDYVGVASRPVSNVSV